MPMQSVGDYNGKNSIFSDDYENLGFTVANKQMTIY